MEETQKITMKDVRIDMKVENNEMKSAHFEIGRILICRLQVISYHMSNLPEKTSWILHFDQLLQ